MNFALEVECPSIFGASPFGLQLALADIQIGTSTCNRVNAGVQNSCQILKHKETHKCTSPLHQMLKDMLDLLIQAQSNRRSMVLHEQELLTYVPPSDLDASKDPPMVCKFVGVSSSLDMVAVGLNCSENEGNLSKDPYPYTCDLRAITI